MDPLFVSKAESGQKLLNFLARRVEATPPELQRWIRTGQVRRNKGRVKPFDRVEEGDEIRIPPFAVLKGLAPPSQESPLMPYPGAIFEDENILVLNKPAGLPVQGGTGHKDSVAARLAAYYASAAFIPAPAHRLDKETSGLLLAGKTYASLRFLSDLFARNTEEAPCKEYLAWVWGTWPHEEPLTLEDSLIKDEALHKVRTVPVISSTTSDDSSGQTSDRAPDEADNAGKHAVSMATRLETRQFAHQSASLMLIRLITGRTHQIRVQLAERGFPIVGDAKYGNPQYDAAHSFPALKLHSCRIHIPGYPPFEALPPWNDGRNGGRNDGWSVTIHPAFQENNKN